MNDLLQETNGKLLNIVGELDLLTKDYADKIASIDQEIAQELDIVKKYKDDFFQAREKIEKTNNDIETFERDYNSLLEKFKDDEIGSILLNSNNDLAAKLEEKRRKIVEEKKDINNLIAKAEVAKNRLVKLTAEKKIMEVRLTDIEDIFEYYKKALQEIVNYTTNNENDIIVTNKKKEEEAKQKAIEEENKRKEEEKKAKDEEKKGKKKDKGQKEEPNEEPVNKDEEIKEELGLPDEDEITFDFDDLEKIINFDDNLDNEKDSQ